MPTRARVAAVAQNGRFRQTIDANRQYVLSLLDEALNQHPDLVCLPEAFTMPGVRGLTLQQRAEPVPGPTTDAVARRARDRRCHVICPLKRLHDGRIFNSAVIIGRDGRICGIYDKVCPVTSAPDYTVLEDGVTPGSETPVFDLDFGRVGVQICFDVGFAENWAALAAGGARMVFWPSAYDGGYPLWAYAYIHHYWVVSSVRTGRSRIIDPCGQIMCETNAEFPVVIRDVNLDFAVCHLDFNYRIPAQIQAKYAGRVDVRRHEPGCSHFVVEPVDPAITVESLQKEFGFETTQQYHDRHREAYRRLRDGRPLAPQDALHGRRPQYG